MAASVEVAFAAKLKADTAVNTAVGGRVFPQFNTQEPEFPEIVYTLLGADGTTKLGGGSGSLKAYTIRAECYAATELAAVALGKLVRDALTPSSGNPWRDLTAGVLGCFHVDSGGDFTDDGVRFHSETFTVWFRPT